VALEDLQRTHNRVITQIGNTSASNDPKQIPHDATEGLIKGAAKLAAGQQLGLTQDETLALISRMSRRQPRADEQPLTENQVLARLQQVSNSLADVSEGAELRGTSVREDAPVDPFGQDQSQYYEYREGDTGYDQQEISKLAEQLSDMEDQDSLGRRRYERGQVRLKTGVNPGDYDDMADMLDEMKPQRDDMTPKVALQQALAELEASGAAGSEGYAQVTGALEDDIALGRIQRAADASIAGEMVRRDSKDFNAEAREANYYRAETDALQERRRMYGPGGYGMDGDINFELMRTKPTFGQITQRQDGAYIDENGNTVAVQGPERAVMGSNTPSNSQALNAPTAQSAQSWVAGQAPDYYDGGRTFGDLQQVNIGGTTTELAKRIRGMKIGNKRLFSKVKPQVRSIDELQAVVNAIVRVAGEEGVTLGTKEVNPQTGRMRTKRSANPGTVEALNLLRYTPAEQERIASALFQLGASKSSGIDNEMKRRFFAREGDPRFRDDITFGSVDALPSARPDETQAQLARINPGQTIENRDIVSALRDLEVADARKPFMGAVIDPSTGKVETNAGPGRIYRFNNTGVTGEDIEPFLREQAEGYSAKTGKPIDEDRLKVTTTKARLTDERARRDRAKRRQLESDIKARRGPAPSEPNPSMSGPAGYGDALRRVTDDAREQSSNMELSDLIRGIRRGRTR
tara:strand:- start:2433 stop:4502 length:2070 start_codon:yes stop_codon:yes gene_type:complete